MAIAGTGGGRQIAITVRVVDQATKALEAIGLQMGRLGGGLFGGMGGIAKVAAGLAAMVGSVVAIGFSLEKAVALGVRFNATLELAKLGIAGVLATNLDFVDSQGRVAQGMDAVVAASVEATKQMKLLQIAGLETVGTTEQLVVAFQQAVAAGTYSRLNLEQIRNITIGIVQAATALNMPTEQFNEEIRSLFEGTINIHSRVSRALRITNEEITKWRAQGPHVFYQEVFSRLEKFVAAGPLLMKTWVVAWSNVKESLQVALGGMFAPIMKELTEMAVMVQERILFVNKTLGEFGVQPKMLNAFKFVGMLLEDLGSGAKSFMSWLLDKIAAFGDWLEKNRVAVYATWEAFKGLAAQVAGVLADLVSIVALTVRWGVETNRASYMFRSIAFTIAIIRDGVEFVIDLMLWGAGVLMTPITALAMAIKVLADVVGVGFPEKAEAMHEAANAMVKAQEDLLKYGSAWGEKLKAGELSMQRIMQHNLKVEESLVSQGTEIGKHAGSLSDSVRELQKEITSISEIVRLYESLRGTPLTFDMVMKPPKMGTNQETVYKEFNRWRLSEEERYQGELLQLTGDTAGKAMMEKARFDKAYIKQRDALMEKGLLQSPEWGKEITANLNAVKLAADAVFAERRKQDQFKSLVELAELELQNISAVFTAKRQLTLRQYANNIELQRAHLIALTREEMDAWRAQAREKEDLYNKIESLRVQVSGDKTQIIVEQNRQALLSEERVVEDFFRRRMADTTLDSRDLVRLAQERERKLAEIRGTFGKKTADETTLSIATERSEIVELYHQYAELAHSRVQITTAAEAAVRAATKKELAGVIGDTDEARLKREAITMLGAERIRKIYIDEAEFFRTLGQNQLDFVNQQALATAQVHGNELEVIRLQNKSALERENQQTQDHFRGRREAYKNDAEMLIALDEELEEALLENRRRATQRELQEIRQAVAGRASVIAGLREQYVALVGTQREQAAASLATLQAQRDAELAVVGLTAAQRAAIETLYLEKIRQKQEEVHGTFAHGLARGLNEYIRTAQTAYQFGRDAAQIAVDAMTNSFDAFFTITRNGFKDWKDVVIKTLESIADAVQKLMVRMLVLKVFEGLAGTTLGGFLGISAPGGTGGMATAPTGGATFGMAKGGVLPGRFMPFKAFASGGIVGGPTLGLIGEGKMREAVVPLPDGRSIPVTGGVTNVQINMINESGQPMAARERGRRQEHGKLIIDVVMQHLATNPDFRAAVGSVR